MLRVTRCGVSFWSDVVLNPIQFSTLVRLGMMVLERRMKLVCMGLVVVHKLDAVLDKLEPGHTMEPGHKLELEQGRMELK